MPNPETPITVESCLAELRELTVHRCEVCFFTVGWIEITVWANSIIPLALFKTRRSTPDDCMAQVREWKAKQ